MTPRTLHAVLRTLSDAVPADDAEVLRRFVEGDGNAFAELVRRHGRLVWSVSRHLTRSDAEADDAFQATFLVLLKNAAKVRDAGRLSAWLHGVAYRICSKTRLAANRRVARERTAAVSERNGHAVADSAWDRALAAVHEEVGQLPESLRVPFVLCCLEGKGATEAAEQLGWKLGTLSGRLTRAKEALLARLEARGLTLGAIAALGLAAPPSAALAKAAALAKVGFVIPMSILQLSQGVIGMSTFSFKVLAAAVLVACGLGVGVGSGWVATAEAQSPPVNVPPPKTDHAAETKRLQTEFDQVIQALVAGKDGDKQNADAARTLLEAMQKRLATQAEQDYAKLAAQFLAQSHDPKEAYTAKTTKWEYDFVVVSDMTQSKFVAFLQDRENRGWDYNGTTTLTHQGKPTEIWVFRRPAKGAEGYTQLLQEYYKRAADPQQRAPQALQHFQQRMRDGVPADKAANDPKNSEAIAREIARLQDQLAKLHAKPMMDRVLVPPKELPLEPTEMLTVLGKLAEKKFGKDRYSLTASSMGLTIDGDKEVIDWFRTMIKRLGEK